MRWLLTISVVIMVTQHCVAPPVGQNKETDEKHESGDNEHDPVFDVEYQRYLTEVVNLLESQPEFVAKMANFSQEDIRSGRIAKELDHFNVSVRTQLDEAKRREVERLRRLGVKMNEINSGYDVDHLKILEHIDYNNAHTFEREDLKRLIKKATKDLSEADKKRRDEFTEYEMKKKLTQEEILKNLDEEKTKKFEHEQEMMKEKDKKHERIHHPGSLPQLQEVWNEQDHMNSAKFNPREFFYMHDTDSNKLWDRDEVKALFVKELDKTYKNGELGSDHHEREEELERMREHTFAETDENNDGFISLEEFINQSQKPDFNKDDGWETVKEKPVFTDDQYQNYVKEHQQQIHEMIMNGELPPDFMANELGIPLEYLPQPGHGVPHHQQQQFHGQAPPQQQYHGQLPPQQQQFHGQVPPQQQQFHGQVPPQQQQFQGQVPPQQQFHGQLPPQDQYHGQLPPQEQYHGQLPPQHVQQPQYQVHQQVPQYQAQPAQHQPPSPQYHQQQAVQQQQQHAQQAEHQQQHPQQGHVPMNNQLPVQQQITVQSQPAVPSQQKVPSQGTVEEHAPIQQHNGQPTNGQAQQHSGLNSPQAAAPNVVSV